jgi:hypothetical protein
MKKNRNDRGPTVLEAVDYLSQLAEIDVSLPEEEREHSLAFYDENIGKIQETFQVLQNYLQHLYENEKGELKDLEMQRGVQAIMILAAEAVQKMDQLVQLPEKSLTKLPEYKDLQKYYLEKIIKRFRKDVNIEEEWEKEWQNLEAPEVIEAQKKGLKDLETVRRDRDYELFLIRRENGKPFFHPNLLRHLRLVGEFDETLTDFEGDDPLLKIKSLEDRDAHDTAKEILQMATPYLDEFYKEAMRHKDKAFPGFLNEAAMALMLAANPRNLLENSSGKSSLRYFADFHQFLRQALASLDYQRYVTAPLDPEDDFAHCLINLAHAFSCFLFMRVGNRKETVRFIKQLIEKGTGVKPAKKASGVWEEILQEDEQIRSVLKQHPSGPILKTLDYFREGDEKKGFDPIIQENSPSQLYNFSSDDFHVTVLRMPSPIHQEVIDKAEIVQEFRGFLRGLQTQMKGQRHLLFDLQDRTSWHERARSVALEQIQKEAEFAGTLSVVTICKHGEFYEQIGAYQNLKDPQEFMAVFQDQIESGQACGYYFPATLDLAEIHSFAKSCMQMVHTLFFDEKPELSREDRRQFIELFYQFFYLKLILLLKPDSISFTCKDAIDVGEAAAAGFFAFLRMMSQNTDWKNEEKEFFQWMLYSPALFIRERTMDNACFSRIVSAMQLIDSILDSHRKTILDQTHKLLGNPVFRTLEPKAA